MVQDLIDSSLASYARWRTAWLGSQEATRKAKAATEALQKAKRGSVARTARELASVTQRNAERAGQDLVKAREDLRLALDGLAVGADAAWRDATNGTIHLREIMAQLAIAES